MAKAKILKIPARGDWEFVEVETDADGNLPLETMQSMVGGELGRYDPVLGTPPLGNVTAIRETEVKRGLQRSAINTGLSVGNYLRDRHLR